MEKLLLDLKRQPRVKVHLRFNVYVRGGRHLRGTRATRAYLDVFTGFTLFHKILIQYEEANRTQKIFKQVKTNTKLWSFLDFLLHFLYSGQLIWCHMGFFCSQTCHILSSYSCFWHRQLVWAHLSICPLVMPEKGNQKQTLKSRSPIAHIMGIASRRAR